VGVGKKDQTFSAVVVADDSSHAYRLEEGFVEARRAPVCGSVRARRDEAAMGFGFAAYVEHDTAVLQLHGDGFIRIDPLLGVGHGDLAGLPGLALIDAVDRRGDAGAVGIDAFTGGEPMPGMW